MAPGRRHANRRGREGDPTVGLAPSDGPGRHPDSTGRRRGAPERCRRRGRTRARARVPREVPRRRPGRQGRRGRGEVPGTDLPRHRDTRGARRRSLRRRRIRKGTLQRGRRLAWKDASDERAARRRVRSRGDSHVRRAAVPRGRRGGARGEGDGGDGAAPGPGQVSRAGTDEGRGGGGGEGAAGFAPGAPPEDNRQLPRRQSPRRQRRSAADPEADVHVGEAGEQPG